MVVVIKKKGESKDAMFKQFSMSFTIAKVPLQVRKKQFYKRPSIVRKEEEKERRSRRFSHHA